MLNVKSCVFVELEYKDNELLTKKRRKDWMKQIFFVGLQCLAELLACGEIYILAFAVCST